MRHDLELEMFLLGLLISNTIFVLVDTLATVAEVLFLTVVYWIWLLLSIAIFIFALVLGHDVSDHSCFVLDHLTVELLERFEVFF